MLIYKKSEAFVKGTITTAHSFISGWDADQETKFNNFIVLSCGHFDPKENLSPLQ